MNEMTVATAEGMVVRLRKENQDLKDELATEKKSYQKLYDKYCVLWMANNKRHKKINVLKMVIAAPFALIASPFVMIGEGWMKVANWITGEDGNVNE